MSNKEKKDVVEVPAVAIEIAGLKKDEALTKLIAEYGMTYPKAIEYWAENRPAAGFANRFYDKLREGELNETDFVAFLKDESDNVRNHKSHYNSIRVLSNDVWVKAKALAEVK